jgi:hypothetical protein
MESEGETLDAYQRQHHREWWTEAERGQASQVAWQPVVPTVAAITALRSSALCWASDSSP